jgi:hypothetical protein
MTPSPKPTYIPPTTSRVLASTAGTVPVSVLAAAAVARFLPISEPAALSVGYALWIPIWLAAACWIARAHGAPRAWLLTFGSTLAVGACVFLIPH